MIKIKNLQKEKVTVAVYNHALPHESHRLAGTEFISLKENEYVWVTEHQAKFFASPVVNTVNGVDINNGRAINSVNFLSAKHEGAQNKFLKRFVVEVPKATVVDAPFVIKHGLKNVDLPVAIFEEVNTYFVADTSVEGQITYKLTADGETEAAKDALVLNVDVLYYSL